MKITNGKHIIEVTSGAYDNLYVRQGFVPFEEAHDRRQTAGVEPGEQTDEEKFLAEITVKPISQWNTKELQRYGMLKGIPVNGVKANELREVIKQELEKDEND